DRGRRPGVLGRAAGMEERTGSADLYAMPAENGGGPHVVVRRRSALPLCGSPALPATKAVAIKNAGPGRGGGKRGPAAAFFMERFPLGLLAASPPGTMRRVSAIPEPRLQPRPLCRLCRC